jgi:predicted tellurium resistance membrane protein TerC
LNELIGRGLVVLGYLITAIGAMMSPVAYAYDLLETFPAIVIALAVIAVGVGMVLLGDRIMESGLATGQSGQPNEQAR